MAWGSASSATQLTSITTEQFFDVTPQLNPQETAHVQVEANPVSSPTDNLVVSFYGSLDGTNYADTPFMQAEIDKATDPNMVDFFVTGVYQFRVGVERSGSTDTITSADMSVRVDGVGA